MSTPGKWKLGHDAQQTDYSAWLANGSLVPTAVETEKDEDLREIVATDLHDFFIMNSVSYYQTGNLILAAVTLTAVEDNSSVVIWYWLDTSGIMGTSIWPKVGIAAAIAGVLTAAYLTFKKKSRR